MRLAPHSFAALVAVARPLLVFAACAAYAACAGCNKDEPRGAPAPGKPAAPSGPAACEIVKGTWRIEGFAGTGPAASASAAQLNAGMDDQARSMRIAYTGTRVKMWSPGSLLISNAYDVKESAAKRCLLDVRGERTEIEVIDHEHVLVERGAANVGARMMLVRSNDEPPAVGPQ